jgi:hypothetical protein
VERRVWKGEAVKLVTADLGCRWLPKHPAPFLPRVEGSATIEAHHPEGVPVYAIGELGLLPSAALTAGQLVVALVGHFEKM